MKTAVGQGTFAKGQDGETWNLAGSFWEEVSASRMPTEANAWATLWIDGSTKEVQREQISSDMRLQCITAGLQPLERDENEMGNKIRLETLISKRTERSCPCISDSFWNKKDLPEVDLRRAHACQEGW